jgi:hypothetical protein
MRVLMAGVVAAISLSYPTAAWAETPEGLDQLEPDAGEWQLEYNGQFGSTKAAERPHEIEAYYGVSDKLAIGVEVEGEAEDGDFSVGEFGVSLLYRFTEADDGELGAGLMVSAALGDDGGLSEAEARFIVEQKSDKWWLQGNAMLRHANEDGDKGELLAYGWNVSHAVAGNFWFGLEGSGQAARLGGFAGGLDKAHFAGPAAVVEIEPSESSEIEIGLAWFRRLGDEGPRNAARLFVQMSF